MPEIATVEPSITVESIPAVQTTPEPAKETSLVERVAKFKPETVKSDTKPEEPIFDYKDIEAIKDPTAKSIAEKAYKSLQSGFNKKFEEVARLRKDLEAQKSQTQPKQPWTADKIQRELLSDPQFVAEAQRLAQANPNPQNPQNSGMSDTEWSELNAGEKAKFQLLESKISQLEQQNSVSQQQAAQVQLQQQHQVLQSKYANYAPDIVNTTVQNIIQGKTQITLEDIWKSTDYEEAVNRAYQLGRTDALGKHQDKLQASSFDGGNVNPSKPIVEPVKGESGMSLFRRIAQARLAQVANTPR